GGFSVLAKIISVFLLKPLVKVQASTPLLSSNSKCCNCFCIEKIHERFIPFLNSFYPNIAFSYERQANGLK
ncbi:hypothetical protein, partial [Bartonella sp. AA86SXKL]|uniref:hypothetical protein n=1 Tax=Bartonella sp. AA86SXKL TaxID=3243441 RepID=UPI0035CF5B4E